MAQIDLIYVVAQSGGLSTFAMGPLYLIAVLAPGMAFVKATMWGGYTYDTLSRLDKIGASLIAGLFLSFGLLLISTTYFDYGPFQLAQPPDLTLTEITSAIIIEIVLAAFLGVAVGGIYTEYFADGTRNFNDFEEPWDYTTSNIREKEVTIRTDGGDEIYGIVARYSSKEGGGDLVISPVYPESRVDSSHFSDAGEKDTLYIRENSISEIHYTNQELEDEFSDVLIHGDIESENADRESNQKSLDDTESRDEEEENNNGS